jgi:hypothetical protein
MAQLNLVHLHLLFDDLTEQECRPRVSLNVSLVSALTIGRPPAANARPISAPRDPIGLTSCNHLTRGRRERYPRGLSYPTRVQGVHPYLRPPEYGPQTMPGC